MSKAAENTPRVEAAKDVIYAKLDEYVQTKTGKRIGKSGGRILFDTVVEEVFSAAAMTGGFRFNGGFGSLHVKTYAGGTRRLPSGQEVSFGERQKIRYEEGVVTKALVKNGGDLDEAKKVKGTRERKGNGKDAEVAPKEKKKEPKATASPPPQATSEGSDADLDLD